MSLLRIVQTLGLLECCEGRKGKSSDSRKYLVPDGECSSAWISGSSQKSVGGVGINFQTDRTGALVVRSLIPQGTLDGLVDNKIPIVGYYSLVILIVSNSKPSRPLDLVWELSVDSVDDCDVWPIRLCLFCDV
jgi:hypothetical protein